MIYDYQAGYTAGDSSGHFTHDLIGNYFITGPRTTNASNAFFQLGNQTLFSRDNLLDSNRDGALNGVSLAVGGGATALAAAWSDETADIPARSAAEAFADVVAHAGALPRDDVDANVIADVMSLGKAGDLWAHQSGTGLDNGGYGSLNGAPAPVDTDGDGMPDAWEMRYGLNPQQPSDGAADFDHTGYPNLEKYVDSLLDGLYP